MIGLYLVCSRLYYIVPRLRVGNWKWQELLEQGKHFVDESHSFVESSMYNVNGKFGTYFNLNYVYLSKDKL